VRERILSVIPRAMIVLDAVESSDAMIVGTSRDRPTDLQCDKLSVSSADWFINKYKKLIRR